MHVWTPTPLRGTVRPPGLVQEPGQEGEVPVEQAPLLRHGQHSAFALAMEGQ